MDRGDRHRHIPSPQSPRGGEVASSGTGMYGSSIPYGGEPAEIRAAWDEMLRTPERAKFCPLCRGSGLHRGAECPACAGVGTPPAP
jgi:hypothetical protein